MKLTNSTFYISNSFVDSPISKENKKNIKTLSIFIMAFILLGSFIAAIQSTEANQCIQEKYCGCGDRCSCGNACGCSSL